MVNWVPYGYNYTYNIWGNDNIGQVRVNGTVNRYYYLKDHLGSIKMTVGSTGNIVGYDDYYPYGMTMSGRSLTGSADARYKFTGKERDSETGWDYFIARDYDSRIGRMLSIDPHSSLYPSLSPYNYAGNNPITFFDPTGMDSTNSNKTIPVNQNTSTATIDPSNLTNNIFGNLKTKSLEAIQSAPKNITESGIKAADFVSDASDYAVIAAAGYTFVTGGTSDVIIPGAAAIGRVADVTSLGLKTLDWLAFDGSGQAALNQLIVFGVNIGFTGVLNKLSEKVVVKNSSGMLGPLFRSSSTGRFVTNRFGFGVTAVKDATGVVSSQILRKLVETK